jgi:tetratricopeptide (TPR) repeat protein
VISILVKFMIHDNIISSKSLKLFNKALKLQNKGLFNEAIDIYKPLSSQYPQQYEIRLNLGTCYYGANKFINAIEIFHPLHETRPNDIQLLNLCAVSYIGINNFEMALSFFKLIIRSDPENVEAWINMTCTANLMKNYTDSLYFATKALSLNPKDARLYTNMGASLQNFHRYQDALICYETAVLLDPNNPSAISNIATVKDKMGLHFESINKYKEALSFCFTGSKDENEILYRMSYPTLSVGNLNEGWKLYEHGFAIDGAQGRMPYRKFSKPQWLGQNIKGKRLLIWREQGIGDEILFFSLISNIFNLCDDCIIECDARLVTLLQRSFPDCTVRQEPAEQIQNSNYFEDFDFHIPAGSLCRFFKNDPSNIIKSKGYLKPSNVFVEKFNSYLNPHYGKLLVGISWRSGDLTSDRNIHYAPLSSWEQILRLPNIQFVNLQYGNCKDELLNVKKHFGIEILDFIDLDIKNDLEGLAGLISNLDFVISAATFASPFSQALGVPVKLIAHKSWVSLGQNEWPWFDNVKVYTPNSILFPISTCFQSICEDIETANTPFR